MRKLLVPLGVIAVAVAVAATPASAAYRTSPKEGRAVSQADQKGWPFRTCWRIGPNGAGYWSPPGGVLPGGIVCRFSSEPSYSPEFDIYVCVTREIAVKQLKKRHKGKKIFELWTVSRGNSQRWDGDWCNLVPGAEEPPPPNGAIGPPLF